MDLMLLWSPLMLSLFAIAVLLVCILYILDRRRTFHNNHLRQLMRAFINTHAMKSFSIIIKLNEKSEPIPLLDRLKEQGYPQLQVIILTDTKIDKKIISELRRVQRKNRANLPIRIIHMKSEGDEHALIRRYANGDALLWLMAEEQLTKDFFIRMSFELLDESRDAVSPRLALRVNDTLGSASQALNLIARQTVTSLLKRGTTYPLVIRRAAYLDDAVHNVVSVEHSAINIPNRAAMSMNILIEAIILISILSVGVISAMYLPYGWQIVTLGFAGAIVILMTVRLFIYPYSLWTKIALTMLIPLWPIVAVVCACGTVLRRLLSKLRKRPTHILSTPTQ